MDNYKQQLEIQIQELQNQLLNLTDKINQTNIEDLQALDLAGYLHSLNANLENHLNVVFDGDILADINTNINTNYSVGNEATNNNN